MGLNGVDGYILNEHADKADKLFPIETKVINGHEQEMILIPLYAADGETVIDSFPIVIPVVVQKYIEPMDQ